MLTCCTVTAGGVNDMSEEAVESVSLRQAAGLLAMSYGEAHRRATGGRLPGAYRLGGRWKVRLAVLKAWIERSCPEPGGSKR